MTQSNNIMNYFEEKQFFRQKLLWIIILFFPILSLYGIYEQLILGNPVGNKPLTNNGLIIFSIFIGFGLPIIFWLMNLSLRISKRGFHYMFFPIHLKEHLISFDDIVSYKLRTYSPIREFGGWGIRYGFECKAYTVSGNKGLEITLKNGRKILFGSQKQSYLVKAIKSAQKSNALLK